MVYKQRKFYRIENLISKSIHGESLMDMSNKKIDVILFYIKFEWLINIQHYLKLSNIPLYFVPLDGILY